MLGIDVSKGTLSCTLFDPATQEPRWVREVPNTAAGVARLLRMTPVEAPWALEPTGRYSQTVARTACEAGRAVLLAQPKRAKKYLQSLQDRAKTDRLDSYGLGLYALKHKLPPYPLKPAMVEQLDQLLTARRGLSQSIASLQVRIAELPHAAAVLRQSVAALQEQRDELDRQIQQLTTAIPTTAAAETAAAGEARETPECFCGVLWFRCEGYRVRPAQGPTWPDQAR
jgi:transposase